MLNESMRFALCEGTSGKSTEQVIVHQQEPQFRAKAEFDEQRKITSCKLLEMICSTEEKAWAYVAMKEIPKWYEVYGIHQSKNADDKVIAGVMKMDFLKDTHRHFTIEQAREMIRVLFPRKNKRLYKNGRTPGVKHLFESVSLVYNGNPNGCYKYCSKTVLEVAFTLEGFRYLDNTGNYAVNLVADDVNRAYRLFWPQ